MPARDPYLQEALYEYSRDNRVLLLAHSDMPLGAEAALRSASRSADPAAG